MSIATVYEHAHKKGKRKITRLDELVINQVYSLDSIGMKDRISSVKRQKIAETDRYKTMINKL